MSSVKNSGLVSNPDDMYRIIFSSSCLPDLHKLQASNLTRQQLNSLSRDNVLKTEVMKLITVK